MSTPVKNSRDRRCAGAGSRIVFAPSRFARRSAAATVSSGVSSWNSAYREFLKLDREPSISLAGNALFAPGDNDDRVLAGCIHADERNSGGFASHRRYGADIDTRRGETRLQVIGEHVVSDASDHTDERARRQAVRPRMPDSRPCRRGSSESSRPRTVSPGAGRCSVRTTKSMFRLPRTTMAGFTVLRLVSDPAESPCEIDAEFLQLFSVIALVQKVPFLSAFSDLALLRLDLCPSCLLDLVFR